MNTKDFLRLGVPLGETTRRAPDFVAKFILGGGDKCGCTRKLRPLYNVANAFVLERQQAGGHSRGQFPRDQHVRILLPSSSTTLLFPSGLVPLTC